MHGAKRTRVSPFFRVRREKRRSRNSNFRRVATICEEIISAVFSSPSRFRDEVEARGIAIINHSGNTRARRSRQFALFARLLLRGQMRRANLHVHILQHERMRSSDPIRYISPHRRYLPPAPLLSPFLCATFIFIIIRIGSRARPLLKCLATCREKFRLCRIITNYKSTLRLAAARQPTRSNFACNILVKRRDVIYRRRLADGYPPFYLSWPRALRLMARLVCSLGDLSRYLNKLRIITHADAATGYL